MIAIADAHTTVECSIEHAFLLISNMERFVEWFPEVIAIASANDLDHGEINKAYIELVSIPLRGKRSINIVVVESVPDKRFVTEGSLRPLLPRMEVDLVKLETGRTLIKWRMLSRSNNLFVKILLLPLARNIMQRRAASGVLALKALLERRSS